MISDDLFELTARVTGVFETLSIPYMVGGSLVSSTYGRPRMTQDIDLVADFPAAKSEQFTSLLGSDFYCDAESIREAVRTKRSFNILHPTTAWKFDVFMIKDSAFARSAFTRRMERDLAGSGGKRFWVCSPEDIILEKLAWFESGGRVSERQWGDIIGVLKLSGPKLSREYMEHWAPTLSVNDLLQKAMREAGLLK